MPFLSGCQKSQTSSESFRANSTNQQRAAKPTELKVVEDEWVVKGAQATIRGSVQNVSEQRLENLILTLEFVRREDDGKEIKEVSLDPASLSPGETGDYSLTISNHDWKSSRLLQIRSSSKADTLAFSYQPGAKRPPERLPEGKKIMVQRPRPKGEEFLNTPDNPEVIP